MRYVGLPIMCGAEYCNRVGVAWLPIECQSWGSVQLVVCQVHVITPPTLCPCGLCRIARRAMAPLN